MLNASAVAAETRIECTNRLNVLGGLVDRGTDALERLDGSIEGLRALASMIGNMPAVECWQPDGLYWMINKLTDDVERASNSLRVAMLKPAR